MEKNTKQNNVKLYLVRVSLMMLLHKMGYSFNDVKSIMNAPTRDYAYRAATGRIQGHDSFVASMIEKIGKAADVYAGKEE